MERHKIMAKTPESTKLDAKQIDKIQKLINLANNNPNEHEANLAARSVCKMLNGYLFPINLTAPPPSAQPKPPSYQEDWFGFRPSPRQREYGRGFGGFNPYEDLYDRFYKETTKGRTPPGSYNKEAKQAEPETKSAPHKDNPGKDNPYDDFKQAYEKVKYTEEYVYDEVHADDFWDEYYEQFLKSKTGQHSSTFNFTNLSKEELEVFIRHSDWDRNIDKKHIECAKCKKRVLTGYPGEEWVFVCMQCELKVAAKRSKKP